MSIRVMSLVWDGMDVGGTEMLCLLALADWCDDTGGSLFPSIRTVALKIRCSEKQARRTLHKLAERGLIQCVSRATGGSGTRRWRLDVEMLQGMAARRLSEIKRPTVHQRPVDDDAGETDEFDSTSDLDALAGVTPPVDVTPPAGVTPPVDVTPPAGVTPPVDVTPPAGVTPPMGVPLPLPWMSLYPSHGCPSTPPMGGSQYTIYPPYIHQLNRQQYRQLQKNDPGVKPDPEDKAGAQDSKPDPEDKAKDKAKGKTKAKAKAKDKLNPADPKDEPPAPKGKGVVIDTDGLVADGVDRQQAADWLMLRATRRLPLTASAWNSIKADGAKLGMDAGQVVRECNSRSWCGFKASWIERERREDPVRPEGRRGAGGSVDRRAELMAKLSGSVPAKHMGDVIEGEARDGGLCD